MIKVAVMHAGRDGKTNLSFMEGESFEDLVGRAVVMASLSTTAVRLEFDSELSSYILTGLTPTINREHRRIWTRTYTLVES